LLLVDGNPIKKESGMTSQRIAVFDTIGDTTDFTVKTAPIPDPGPDEVRFKVAAFALNQADILLTQGRHYVSAELPIRVGYEGCGIVDAIGSDVSSFKVGDRVTCIPNVDGPYSTGGEYALGKAEFLTHWPEGWSAEQSASLWMQYLTPYFPFVELFPFKRGDWVMITAATGGTGLGSVRLAKLLGARVIATTRSENKTAILKEHGADVVLSTDSDSFVGDVMNATDGKGVNLICDTLSGRFVPILAETLADKGIMFIHGVLSGEDIHSLPLPSLIYRGAGIFGYSLINELRKPGALERACRYILDAVATGALPPPLVDRTFPLDAVRSAYDWMKSGKQIGKIVVTIDS
jgi:NADPH:quinone reductase-like Zn-dependent oxidoreductase